MAFRVIQPAGEVKGFKVIKPAHKAGAADDVGGGLETLYGSIPFLNDVRDNAGAAAKTISDTAQGKTSFKRPETWREAIGSVPDAFRAQAADFQANRRAGQQRRRSAADDFRDRRPNVGGLISGVGLAAQVAPALMTGGGSAAPALAANAPRGLMGASARALKPTADAAVMGGLSAQLTGLGGDGTLKERVDTANRTTLPAMAMGAAIPGSMALASKGRRVTADMMRGAGRATARLANRASGGKILDPRQEAAKRLGEALKADGLGPQEVRAALTEWQRTGASSPAFMDLAGENTRALLRAASSKPGPARSAAVGYADRVTADLQDNAIARTRALTPDRRTIPQLEQEASERIRGAATFDEVQPGAGGAGIADALNRRRDVAAQGVDDAYGAARSAGEGVSMPRESVPEFAGRLREAVADFVPDSIPHTRSALSRLDNIGGSTQLREIFGVRSMLSNLRGQPGPEAAAAGRAVRELDAFVDDGIEQGLFAGDDGAVSAWRNAIGQRRQFGQQFEGDDLIARLTARERHGEGAARAVAPEDATNAILGRSGVGARPDLTRDLVRTRDMLGIDSPEWAQFQQEAAQRLLGREAGQEGFGEALEAFARQNPELADVLISPQQRAAVGAAREQIGEAVADRGAVATGRSVMRESPDEFAGAVDTAGDRRPLVQVGAAREIEDMIGRPAEGATGMLNRLSSGTNPRRNLSAAFGGEEAAGYQAAIGNEIDRVANARFISPNTGSQTAPRLADEGLVDLPPMSKLGIAKALFDKLQRGITLTPQEREALVELGTTIVRSGDDLPRIPTTPQAMRLMAPAQRQALSRALAQYQGQSRARPAE